MNKTTLSKHHDFTTEEKLKVGHVRGSFQDCGYDMSWQWLGGKKQFELQDPGRREEITQMVGNIMAEVAPSYHELLLLCCQDLDQGKDHTDLFTCSAHYNYWVRLLPEEGDYNLYIKVYVRDVAIHYYTFGSDPDMPYEKGWVTVIAKDREDSDRVFTSRHPKIDGDLLNCDLVYDAYDFHQTQMPVRGNLHGRCQEVLISQDIILSKKHHDLLPQADKEAYSFCEDCQGYYHQSMTYRFEDLDLEFMYEGCPRCLKETYDRMPDIKKLKDYKIEDLAVTKALAYLDMPRKAYEGFPRLYKAFYEKVFEESGGLEDIESKQPGLCRKLDDIYNQGMGMTLMTPRIERELPPLYHYENKETPIGECMVIAKYFLMNFTWYILEGDRRLGGDWLFFCYVHNATDPHFSELGYVTLNDLKAQVGPLGFVVERDYDFQKTSLKKIKKQLKL